MTRSSQIIKQVIADTGCPQKKIRYKSIPCNLRTNLKASALGLQSTFTDYATSNGLYRHIVSLAANYIVLTETFKEPINDWFRFYLDVWSAVAYYFSPCHMSANRFKPYIDILFAVRPPTAEMANKLKFKTPALTRQHECTTMSENAILHLKQFPDRLYNWIRASIVQIQMKHGLELKNDTYIATKVIECITCIPIKYSMAYLRLKESCENGLFDKIKHLIDERDILGDLVSREVTFKVKKTQQSGTLLDQIFEGNDGDELIYRLLPHLKRYSNICLQILKEENLDKSPRQNRTDVNVQPNELDMEDDLISSIGDILDEENEYVQTKGWTRQRKPKPFRVLPQCKLQRSMVY